MIPQSLQNPPFITYCLSQVTGEESVPEGRLPPAGLWWYCSVNLREGLPIVVAALPPGTLGNVAVVFGGP